jgi:hypothetical protein
MSEPARARPLLELRSYRLELEVLSPLHVGAGGPPLVGATTSSPMRSWVATT